MKKRLIKHHEFWDPRFLEVPLYVYLACLCLWHWLKPAWLAKANSALDHGEIGIGSKFHTQQQFSQQKFLPTDLIDCGDSATASSGQLLQKNLAQTLGFAAEYGYPLILKPDIGMVGKGILKVADARELERRLPELRGKYLIQQYTDYRFEYGIFYTHYRGQSRITGINQKHFPTVTGNGRDSIEQLARAHPRYSANWDTFLQYFDRQAVPAAGEAVRLSFIGSHTMGCMFTDNSDLLTEPLREQVFALLDPQPDFNYGRIDVKAESEAALQRGEFVVIEVNGISSLPTHMFDPSYSLWRTFKILFQHGRYLVKIAAENKSKTMHLLPFFQILKRVKINQSELDRLHHDLKSGSQ